MLILGVQTRWVALALSPILLGAIRVHSGNGWLFASPDGGWEYPLYLFVLCIAQAHSTAEIDLTKWGVAMARNSLAAHCLLGNEGLKPAKLLAKGRRELATYASVTIRDEQVIAVSNKAAQFTITCEGGFAATVIGN